MAKPLVLSLDGQEFPVNLVKIDREKLYGAVEIEAVDEKGKTAVIKVLAPDGKTLIDKGGTALATVTEDGTSIDRTQLSAVDSNGEPVEPVPSSFSGPNILAQAKTEEYLSQIVKSVYALEPADGQALDYLRDHLSTGQMYSFPFSYRGGLEFDSAFVVGAGKDAFMVVGKQASLQYVRLNQAAVLDAAEEKEISADELDFELL
jgi:hypothetical protein